MPQKRGTPLTPKPTGEPNISACAVVVSQGEASNNGYQSSAQFLAVIDSDPNNGGDPHTVDVNSFTDNGTGIDAGFDLILAC